MKHIFDDNDKNKYEALSKAEVIALLQQVVESGELPENILEGIALTLRNPIDNQDYKIAFCTQAKYNELKVAGQTIPNCLYHIIDDNSYDDIVNAIESLQIAQAQNDEDIAELKTKVNTLEDNHLYRHDITIFGTGYAVYFTLYLKTDTQITASNVLTYVTTTLTASGYVYDEYGNGPVYSIHSTGGIFAGYFRQNGDMFNQRLDLGTYTDIITQIF